MAQSQHEEVLAILYVRLFRGRVSGTPGSSGCFSPTCGQTMWRRKAHCQRLAKHVGRGLCRLVGDSRYTEACHQDWHGLQWERLSHTFLGGDLLHLMSVTGVKSQVPKIRNHFQDRILSRSSHEPALLVYASLEFSNTRRSQPSPRRVVSQNQTRKGQFRNHFGLSFCRETVCLGGMQVAKG